MELGHYGDRHLAERPHVQFLAETLCSSLEILRYPSLARFACQEGNVNDEKLPSWLEKDLSLPSSSSQPPESPSGGLRLLIAKCDWNQDGSCMSISFSKKTFSIAEKYFGLTTQYSSLITSSQSDAFKYSIYEPGYPIRSGFLCKIASYRNIFYQIAIKHDPTTNLTYGLLLVKSESPVLENLVSSLRSQQQHTTQPSLLPMLASDYAINNSRERLTEAEERLDELEEKMGQHEYEYRPLGNPLELDFLATTRTLNFWGKRVAVDVVRLKCQALMLEKMREWERALAKLKTDENMVNVRNRGLDAPARSAEVEAQAFVADRIEYLIDACNVLLYEAEYGEKRVRALIQVVYQFMAQKDAKVNIALAESSAVIAKASKEDSAVMRTIAIESKRDSSAMKTIAILGMFFLPGTFVAAIFAMPAFDWDGNGPPTIKTGFVYYWAITAPLTVLVLLSWSLAMLLPWRSWVAQVRGKEEGAEHNVDQT